MNAITIYASIIAISHDDAVSIIIASSIHLNAISFCMNSLGLLTISGNVTCHLVDVLLISFVAIHSLSKPSTHPIPSSPAPDHTVEIVATAAAEMQ